MTQTLTIIYILCGFFMSLAGFLALKQQSRSLPNQLFFFCTLACVSWMITLYVAFFYADLNQAELSTQFFRYAFAFATAAISLMGAFILFFPKQDRNIPKWASLSFIVCGTALFFIAGFTPWIYDSAVIEANGFVGDKLGVGYSLFLVYITAIELSSIIIAIKKVRITRGITRKKVLLSFVGFLSFVITASFTNAILPFFDIIIFQQEAVLFSLFFLTPAFYSIYKHRFFNLSYGSLNLTRHLLLLLAFSATTVVLSFLLQNFIAPSFAYGIAALSGLSLYLTLSKHFPELVSEAFKHFRASIFALQTELYSCKNYEELDRLLQKRLVIGLNLHSTQLTLIRSSKKNSKIPIYRKNSLTKYFEEHKIDILVSEELGFQNGNKRLAQQLQKLTASLCFPLYADRELIGLWTLGPKSKQQAYGQEEIELLLELKPHLEICFMNILLKADFRREKNVLKQAIQEKTKTLRDKFNRTKNLFKKQSDHLSITAHEFKTPLNILMLQLEHTLSSAKEDSEVLEDMKVMEKSLNKLKQLTQDLFESEQYDLEKITLDLKPINIQHLILEIFDEFAPLMREKQIAFQKEILLTDSLFILVDETKIRQTLHNLLSNAQKFTPQRGQVSLKVHETPLSVIISVSDSGPGIPDEEKEKIFEKYHHGKEHFGLGMGLYLCKKIIQLHDGSIEIQDTPGGGTTVVVGLLKQPSGERNVGNVRNVKNVKNVRNIRSKKENAKKLT